MNEDEKGWDPELVSFIDEMQKELDKGTTKYGKVDTTLSLLQHLDCLFEISNIIKYAARIAHGDPRSDTDIVKIATYAFFFWRRSNQPARAK
jgi:hypothetical protein